MVVVALSWTAGANATILVDQIDPYLSYFVGGSNWTNFTADLAGEPGGYVLGNISNPADVAGASAVLVVLRQFTDTLSGIEIANLNSFLGTGKRVAIFGENGSWLSWDNSVLGFASLGAAYSNDSSDVVTPVISNSLTAGISSISLVAAGIGSGGSGTSLFSEDVASLWRADNNLLTILDVNVVDSIGNGNSRFEQNVADWLGTSAVAVSEPSSWAIMVSAFAFGTFCMGWRIK
jgi:hypothetical protein